MIGRRLFCVSIFAMLLQVDALAGSDGTRYVFATFPDTDWKLYVGTSEDGVNFSSAQPGPVYSPPSGSLRDPSIIKYGEWYYVCHTAGNFGAVSYFSVAKSRDLQSWTKVKDVSMAAAADSEGNPVQYTWAPEFFVDDDGSVHVFVSVTSFPGVDMSRGHRIHEIHPLDQENLAGEWSVPQPVTGTAFPEFSYLTIPSGAYDPYVFRFNGL